MKGYDTAQVCLNGHLITSRAGTSPSHREKHCSKCGAPTIMTCPQCNEPIRGYYHMRHVIASGPRTPPAFCHSCGHPYPWTEKALATAGELVDLEESLSSEERQALKNDLTNLVSETPRTYLAVNKRKIWLNKAKPAVAASMREIIVTLACEAATKQLLP